MTARRVAIWGSCVSRDAFAVGSRREQLENELPLVHYAARSSWVSQVSRPWRPADPDFGGDLSGFGLRMVQEDFAKTIIDQLVRLQPDILVLDLVDERLPIARVGKTWVTVSEYAKRSDLGRSVVAAADEISAVTQGKRARLFAAAARTVAGRLVRELPHTAFVLNEAPYTTRVADGTSLPEPTGGWARELEAAQIPLRQAVIRAMGGRLQRATPPPEVCLADPAHQWGLTSYHYIEDYNHWLLDTLLAVEPPAEQGRGPSIRRPDMAALRHLLRR